MKLFRTLLVAIAALSTGLVAPAAPVDEARVIVRFKTDADSVKVRRLQARMSRAEVMDVVQTRATGLGLRHGLVGGRLKARMSLDERTHVVTASGMTSAQLVQKLSADGEIEFAVVDGIRKRAAVPNDPYYSVASGGLPAVGQWYLRAPTSDVVSSINAPGAWDVTFGNSNIVVAVIDTGVRKDHPDLAGQFVGGYDFIAYANPSSSVALATANDGNGADSDASDPGDWVTSSDLTALGSSCTSADIGDSSWHGTHVSGLIAAITNNGLGMAGVAGGVKVLPVRVLGKCGGYDSDIIAGMKWAAGISVSGVPDNANPAKVLNLSLGGSGSCTGSTGTLYKDAISQINAKGATIVIAAGNDEGLAVGVPGNCGNVITVGALRHLGSKVGFSNVGTEVSISAPGGNCVNTTSGPCLYPILSASNSGTMGPVAADNSYDAGEGTSFSTPLVAGTVALMYSVKPTLTSTEVTQILKNTARAFVSTGGTAGTLACHTPTSVAQDECYCTTSTCGAGMLDASAAVNSVLASTGGSLAITSSASPTAGQAITLTGKATLASGRSVASWAWTLVDAGTTGSAFTGAVNASTATLSPTAAGTVSVKLVATDDQGAIYETTSSIVVAAAVSSGSSTTSNSSSGGGGGGAVNPLWLLGLMLAAVVLMRRQD